MNAVFLPESTSTEPTCLPVFRGASIWLADSIDFQP